MNHLKMNYISRVMDIDFKKIVTDFKKDITRSFPEYSEVLETIDSEEGLVTLKEYCKTVYPERFFDILYQNNEIFTDASLNTCFLPGVEFKDIWKEDITDTTKETIWKYLQLILFNIVGDIDKKASFGDTSKLFEAIQGDELQSKLKDTMEQMRSMFDMSGVDMSGEDMSGVDMSGCSMDGLPNPEDIHDHISGILDGKLGRLAKEIAEETAEELDIKDATKVDDIFKKLFTNPKQLMDLVKNIGTKLDRKLKSGDLKESELMAEAAELVDKMKDMPGMGNFKDMMGGMGNTAGFQQKMKQQMNMMQMRERMNKKKAAKEAAGAKGTNGEAGEGVGGPEGASMEEALAKAQEAADKMMNELLNMDTLAPKKKRKKKKKKSKH
jgi:hypothetical protein